EKMKEVTSSTMSDLMCGNTSVDFKIYSHAKLELQDFFFKAINSKPSAEKVPAFGRIGLYNSKEGTGKAPRIFFAIGHYSTLHIFLCDPEHEIYKSEN
ncbi:MAG: hypothetical protein KDD04_05425, partial [Sinomicrobium sp.]|nr:hypothetical protein [Sinomicrobium sp.]